jgi:branched-chain amino acid transport system permease protein
MGLMAIREDEDAAKAAGVPTDKLKLLAIVISAFFPGVAGALYSHYMIYIDPGTVFNLALSFQAIMMTLLGGIGTITGPILGACIFTFTSELLRFTIIYKGLHAIFFGFILIVMVLFMPEGMVGWFRRRFRLARVLI